MYVDAQPCQVCGAEVELRARTGAPGGGGRDDGPVGPEDGYVGDADTTVDRRVCTNPDCASHRATGPKP